LLSFSYVLLRWGASLRACTQEPILGTVELPDPPKASSAVHDQFWAGVTSVTIITVTVTVTRPHDSPELDRSLWQFGNWNRVQKFQIPVSKLP